MNGLIRCARCGKLHTVGSTGTMEFVDGYFYCEDCLEAATFVCEHCGERHSLSYSTAISVNGYPEWWCEDCIEDSAMRCEMCGELFPANEMTWSESRGEYLCEHCFEEYGHSDNARVRGYHDAPPLRFIGACRPTWGGLWRGIGIELEVDGGGYTQSALNEIDRIAGEHLHFEHDGSLDDGFEIVTQPHTVDAFHEMPWEEILDICDRNGFSSHDAGTCGLHVHFSREFFGNDVETQNDNIAKLMQFYELYWDDVLKVSRRTESQADEWASRYATVNKKRLKEHAKGDRYSSRYMAINITNPSTVEIRLTRGTLNYKAFMACIDFMTCAVENSCRIGWSDTTDDYEWLVGIKPETCDYLVDRGAFYEAVSRIREERLNESINDLFY